MILSSLVPLKNGKSFITNLACRRPICFDQTFYKTMFLSKQRRSFLPAKSFSLLFIIGLFMSGTLLTVKSFALPSYAVKHRITRCTACHFSPAGGSIRNIQGKLYGAHQFSLPSVSKQDYLSADWRLLSFYAEKSENTRDGLGLMEAVISAQVPLSGVTKTTHPSGNNILPSGQTSTEQVRLIFSHNVSGFSDDRETYLQFQRKKDQPNQWIEFVEIGRLLPPFGLRTDEHRTYTRIISQTTWNDFIVGAGLSANPVESTHYDIVFLNGDISSTPDQLAPDKSSQWGGIINLRWTSPYRKVPLILGASGLYINRVQNEKATAESFYFLVSLQRWTNGLVPLTFSAEYVLAWHMNQQNAHLNTMVTNPSYLQSVGQSSAEAVLGQLIWEISPRWMMIYKFDEMILDTDFRGDFYRRHGIGTKYIFGSNLIAEVRYEFAHASVPSESGNTRLAAQNALWSYVKASF